MSFEELPDDEATTMTSEASRSTFGKYVLLRKLASGGMGEIFLAKQRGPSGFEKLLVIKRILAHHLDKRDYLDMFFSEAKLVARLSHANIIQIHEMGEIDGDYYIAMEYVRGKSLRDVLDALRAEGRTLPLPHAIDLVIKLCEGLGYAHQARDLRGHPMNIVHRDVNPHNVLVSFDGELKLIDFGIAKSEMTSVHTATGTIKGKFVYMSPEQSAADPIDRRSDIFSLGIVLYEALCLENPFVRQNVVLSLEAIQRQEVPPPSTKRPGAEALDAIIAKALEKKPTERYQTTTEMRDDLRNLLRSGDVPAPEEDIATFLHGLFRADIAEEDRLLAEADRATRDSVETRDARGVDAPTTANAVSAAFSDEEPTLAGDEEKLAAMSREPGKIRVGERTPKLVGAVVNPRRAEELLPADENPFSLEVPTRSDRVPRGEASDEIDRPLFPTQEPEPVDSALPEKSAAPASGRPEGSSTRPFEPRPESHALEAAFASPYAARAVVGEATDPDSDSLAIAPAHWPRMLLVATTILVVLATTIAGFLAMRAVIRSRTARDRAAVVAPIEPIAPLAVAKTDRGPASTDEVRENEVPPLPTRNEPPPVAAVAVPTAQVAPHVVDATPEKPATPRTESAVEASLPSAKSTTPAQSLRATAAPVVRPRGEPSASDPPRDTPPKRARLGTLSIAGASDFLVSSDGNVKVASPSNIELADESGTLRLARKGENPWTVTLSYRIQGSGVSVAVASEPWAIVQHDGLSMGRTPQGPVVASTQHRFALMRPGAEAPIEFSLSFSRENP